MAERAIIGSILQGFQRRGILAMTAKHRVAFTISTRSALIFCDPASERHRSPAWNGVPPETMKIQPRILHYFQDGSSYEGSESSAAAQFSGQILRGVDCALHDARVC
jgi:hypothetical protein